MKRTHTLTMILALTATSGMALAGPEAQKKSSDDSTVLRGPKVDHSTTRKDRDEPAMNGDNDRDMMKAHDQRPLTMREIGGALRQLSNNRDGNALDLSEEQRAEIKEITMQLREDMREFQEANREQFMKLREEAAAERKNNAEQAKNNEPQDRNARQEKPMQGQNKAGEKLRSFIENSPPSKHAIARIKEVLTPEQFVIVSEHAKTSRQQMAQRVRESRRDAAPGEEGMRDAPRRRLDEDGQRARRAPNRDAQRGQRKDEKKDQPIDD